MLRARARFRTAYTGPVRRLLDDARAGRREIEGRRELAALVAQLPSGEEGLGLVSLRRRPDPDEIRNGPSRR